MRNKDQVNKLRLYAQSKKGQLLLDYLKEDLPAYDDIPENISDAELASCFKATKEIRKFIFNKLNYLSAEVIDDDKGENY